MKTFTTIDKIRTRLAQTIRTGWAYIAIDQHTNTVWISACKSRRAATSLEESLTSECDQATAMIDATNTDNAAPINIYRATILNHKICELNWMAEYLEPPETKSERDYSAASLALTASRKTQSATARA